MRQISRELADSVTRYARTSMRFVNAYRNGTLTLEQVIKTVKVYSSHRRIGVDGFEVPTKVRGGT